MKRQSLNHEGHEGTRRKSLTGFMRQFVQLVVLRLLRAYKWAISPMFPPACRYVPTCSEYAMEAVERYGALRGGVLAVWRLLRCHPFADGGYDPVVKSGNTHLSQQRGEVGHPHCVGHPYCDPVANRENSTIV